MTIARVRSGLAKMVFLSWLSLSVFVLISLASAPNTGSVTESASGSTTPTATPSASQTLGAVQDVMSTPTVSTDAEGQPPPVGESQSSDNPQPAYSSAPRVQTEQPTVSSGSSDDQNFGPQSESPAQQEPVEDKPPSVTGSRLMCVPGVLCI